MRITWTRGSMADHIISRTGAWQNEYSILCAGSEIAQKTFNIDEPYENVQKWATEIMDEHVKTCGKEASDNSDVGRDTEAGESPVG